MSAARRPAVPGSSSPMVPPPSTPDEPPPPPPSAPADDPPARRPRPAERSAVARTDDGGDLADLFTRGPRPSDGPAQGEGAGPQIPLSALVGPGPVDPERQMRNLPTRAPEYVADTMDGVRRMAKIPNQVQATQALKIYYALCGFGPIMDQAYRTRYGRARPPLDDDTMQILREGYERLRQAGML